MRAIILTGVLLLSGCAASLPMAELERQAMMTGDWSEVERRERQIARREARNAPDCGNGFVSYCVDTAGDDRCTCISGKSLRDLFAGYR